MKTTFHAVILFAAMVFIYPAYTQHLQVSPSSDSIKSSDVISNPVQQKVLISIFLTDIEHIDTKNQTFEAEFYLWLKWKQGRPGKNIEYMNSSETRNIFYDEWTEDSLQRVSAKVG